MASDDDATASGTVREPTRTLSRYDLVLAVIPLAFLVAVSVAYVTSTALQHALVSAAGASVLALVDALFLRPPGLSGRTGGA